MEGLFLRPTEGNVWPLSVITFAYFVKQLVKGKSINMDVFV